MYGEPFAGWLPWNAFAPDPGGTLAEAEGLVLPVEPLQTPIQHSPEWSWSAGSPYPGPPATVNIYFDYQSTRWWGKEGQGMLVWSGETEFAADIPPAIPQDMSQHIDVWQNYMGGYPSLPRNRPRAFGDQVPPLRP